MRPLGNVLKSMENALSDPRKRAGRSQIVVDSQDLQQLVSEFRALDARQRIDHNHKYFEDIKKGKCCFQCPNFRSNDVGGRRYGTCFVFTITKEIPKDKVSIFESMWCTFGGVEFFEHITDQPKKPDFTPPAQFVGKNFDCSMGDHPAINNTTGCCTACGARLE